MRATRRRGARAFTPKPRSSHLTRQDGGFVVRAEGRRVRAKPRGRRAKLVVNAAGPWVDHVLNSVVGEPPAPPCPPGAGQPHGGEAALSSRPLLYLPEPRRAGHLRHPLRKRLHPDRHHRPGLSRRSGRSKDRRRKRSIISAPPPANISACPSRARGSSGPIPACARFTMTAPPRRRRPPANMCSAWTARRTAGCILNVFGGKITTYRHLVGTGAGEDRKRAGPRAVPPGPKARHCRAAIFPWTDSKRWWRRFSNARRRSRPPTVRRLARAYGTEAQAISKDGNLGRIFGADLGEQRSGVPGRRRNGRCTADDILWRRSKLGLRFSPDEVQALARHLGSMTAQFARGT